MATVIFYLTSNPLLCYNLYRIFSIFFFVFLYFLMCPMILVLQSQLAGFFII